MMVEMVVTYFSKKYSARGQTRLGFTLIELLVVMALIGILATLGFGSFTASQQRAHDAKIKNDLSQLKKALRLYYNDNQAYPGAGQVPTTGDFDNGAGSMYMKNVPVGFTYYANTTGDEEFLLHAVMNYVSDADILASQDRCQPESRSYYDGAAPGPLDYFVCED